MIDPLVVQVLVFDRLQPLLFRSPCRSIDTLVLFVYRRWDRQGLDDEEGQAIGARYWHWSNLARDPFP
jgi:hypothetical protein